MGPNATAYPAGIADELAPMLTILDLERIDRDIYRGSTRSEGEGRVFGGQVAAQALRAAGSTVVADHAVNSLHAYFLRPGRYGTPITYTVDRIRDGGSFTTRRVVALQEGEAILNLDASFHRAEPGGEYQRPSIVDGASPPEAVEPQTFGGQLATHRRPFDIREARLTDVPDTTHAIWMKAIGDVPDDPFTHACIVTFLSDMGPVRAVRGRVGGWAPGAMSASLDHCLWFHHPVRADDFLLYRLDTVAAAGARGVARGEIWTRDGQLAVSVMQEVLARPAKPRP